MTMLFSSWQFQTTICVLFVASCLGQELLPKCESDFCYEPPVEGYRIDNTRLESRPLINDQNQRDERNKRVENNAERSDLGRDIAHKHQILRKLNNDFDRSRDDLFHQETSRRPYNRNNERFLVNYHEENSRDSRREAERQFERSSDKNNEDNRKKESINRQRLQENKQKEEYQIQRRYINDDEYRIRQQNDDRHAMLRQTDDNEIASRTEREDGRQFRKETGATKGREGNNRERGINSHAEEIFREVPNYMMRFSYRVIQYDLPSYSESNRDVIRKNYESRRSNSEWERSRQVNDRETERNSVNHQVDFIPLKYSEILQAVGRGSHQLETAKHSRNHRKLHWETLRQSDVNESENYRNRVLSEDRDNKNEPEHESMEWREYGKRREPQDNARRRLEDSKADRHEILNRFGDFSEVLDKTRESLKREERMSTNKINFMQSGEENEQEHRFYNLQYQHSLSRRSDDIRESQRRTERISHPRLQLSESLRRYGVRAIRESNGIAKNLKERLEILRHLNNQEKLREQYRSVEHRRNYQSQLDNRSPLDDSSKLIIAVQLLYPGKEIRELENNRIQQYFNQKPKRDAIRSWESDYRDIVQKFNKHDAKPQQFARGNRVNTTRQPDQQEIRRIYADAPENVRLNSEYSERDTQPRNENKKREEHPERLDMRSRKSDENEQRIVDKGIVHQRDPRLVNQRLYKRETQVYMKQQNTEAGYRNNRFIEEDDIQKPTVILTKGCVALGQSFIIAYVFMKTLYAQKDLKNQLPVKLREVLGTIRF